MVSATGAKICILFIILIDGDTVSFGWSAPFRESDCLIDKQTVFKV